MAVGQERIYTEPEHKLKDSAISINNSVILNVTKNLNKSLDDIPTFDVITIPFGVVLSISSLIFFTTQ
jgi:hypothetical protein